MNSFDVFVIKGFTVENKLMMMQRKKQFTVARNPEGWNKSLKCNTLYLQQNSLGSIFKHLIYLTVQQDISYISKLIKLN